MNDWLTSKPLFADTILHDTHSIAEECQNSLGLKYLEKKK